MIWVTMDEVPGSSEPQGVQEEEESFGRKRKRMEQDREELQGEDKEGMGLSMFQRQEHGEIN